MNAVACAPVETSAWLQDDLKSLADQRTWNWLTPAEVAEAILFLVSDEARALRGTEMVLSAASRR